MVESVYFTAGLSGIPERDMHFLRSVVLDLKTKVDVNCFFSFQALLDSSIRGENMYSFNDRQISRSDALVAFCDFPSVEMEVMVAHQAGLRIILLHKVNKQPSRILLEFAEFTGNSVLKYSSSDPVSEIVRRILVKLNE